MIYVYIYLSECHVQGSIIRLLIDAKSSETLRMLILSQKIWMRPRYYHTSSGSLLHSFSSWGHTWGPAGRVWHFLQNKWRLSLSSAGFSLTLTFGSNWWTVWLRPPLHSEQVSCPEITTHSHTCTNKNTLSDSQDVFVKKKKLFSRHFHCKGLFEELVLKIHLSVPKVSLKNLLSVRDTADGF